MIEKIHQYFVAHMAPVGDGATPATPVNEERAIALATAALLIEVSRADFEVKGEEREAIARAVQVGFNLSAQETTDLIELAESEADDATSLYQFTSLINSNFDAARKRRVIRMLWDVAFADGGADAHEQHLVRKVADLIHVPHAVFIQTKLAAEAARGA